MCEVVARLFNSPNMPIAHPPTFADPVLRRRITPNPVSPTPSNAIDEGSGIAVEAVKVPVPELAVTSKAPPVVGKGPPSRPAAVLIGPIEVAKA